MEIYIYFTSALLSEMSYTARRRLKNARHAVKTRARRASRLDVSLRKITPTRRLPLELPVISVFFV